MIRRSEDTTFGTSLTYSGMIVIICKKSIDVPPQNNLEGFESAEYFTIHIWRSAVEHDLGSVM